MLSKESLLEYRAKGFTNIGIAKLCQVSPTTVTNWCRRYGLASNTYEATKKKYTLKEDFFENIDTEEKAYVLGFLYADGYNNVAARFVEIRLNPKDKDILEKIRDVLGSNHPITNHVNNKGVECIQYRIYSVKFNQDLSAKGCVPKKSKVLTYPSIPKHLHRHFIRGYFDGDGSIHIRKNNGYVIASLVSTLDMVENIRNKVVKVNGYIKECNNSSGTYVLTFNCSHAKKFLKWIYEDSSIYLDRKYELYKSIVE